MKTLKIAGKVIGEDAPCFIIAEAGVNHNGDIKLARKLIDAAVEAGADAVKFQTFEAEELVTETAEKAAYQKETTGSKESQFQMLKG
ncbi:MAG TPA: N-acetylneuraminate synthase family protein, partial [Dehalococcoidales bacterium]|nr:N-acetylneuraminate synthase family protein [Dehalococcoidales bacterium]